MTNLLIGITFAFVIGGGSSAVGIVPEPAVQPEISATTGVKLALPCHEDEIPIVMPYTWRPSDGDRWIADMGINSEDGEVAFNRLCVPQDDYDEALIDAYIDSQS